MLSTGGRNLTAAATGGKTWTSFLGLNTTVTKLSSRNAVIVSRVYKPPLVGIKENSLRARVPQKLIDDSVIHTEDDKYMVYKVEENQDDKDTHVKLILLKTVEEFGIKGQIISPPSTRGNRDLLLTGLAVYHNEENLQKYADIIIPENTQLYSSDIAQQMVWRWGRKTVSVDVSWDNKWTLEKWHVVAAFRKYKTFVTEDQVSVPGLEKGGVITGPDPDINNKEFIAVLTINKVDKVKVRCRIHQVSRRQPDKQVDVKHFCHHFAEPVWEHEREELEDMPRKNIPRKLRQDSDYADLVAKHDHWRAKRLAKILAS